MTISEWIISLFDVNRKSANLDTFCKGEFIEMTFNLGSKSMYPFKKLDTTGWTKEM